MKVQAQHMELLVQVVLNKLDKALMEANKCSPDFQIFSYRTPWTRTVKYQGKVERSKALITSSIQEQQELKNIRPVSVFRAIILQGTRVHKLRTAHLQTSTTQCPQVESRVQIPELVALQFKATNTPELVAFSWKTPFHQEWRLVSLLYLRARTQGMQLILIYPVTTISTTVIRVGHLTGQWKLLTTADREWEARREQVEEWEQEAVSMTWDLLNPTTTLSMLRVLLYMAIKETRPILRWMVRYSDHQTRLELLELGPGITPPILVLLYLEFLQAHQAARVEQLLILLRGMYQDQQDKIRATEELPTSTQDLLLHLSMIICPLVLKAQLKHPKPT